MKYIIFTILLFVWTFVYADSTTDGARDTTLTGTEQTQLTGTVTAHSDVSAAGSGSIITTAERNKLTSVASNANNYVTANWTNDAATAVAPLITLQGSAGTNMILSHLWIAPTNYLAVRMVGSTTTNLYPVLH